MKLFSSIIIAIVLTVFVTPGYCETVLTNGCSYTAWVCDWCGTVETSVTVNFPDKKNPGDYKARYDYVASNFENAKVVVIITRQGGKTDEIRLTKGEPSNFEEIRETDHPITITTKIDCWGAEFMGTVSADVKVTRTKPYGN